MAGGCFSLRETKKQKEKERERDLSPENYQSATLHGIAGS